MRPAPIAPSPCPPRATAARPALFPATAPAVLALADGTVFRGRAIGASGAAVGEVVFNTAMTGYQEILTDPSYAGQIVTLTYPHIGNVGVNPEDVESRRPFAAGLVIRDLPRLVSNFRSTGDLGAYLAANNIVGIADLDTRRLTRRLREKGAQNGCILAGGDAGDADVEHAVAQARAAPSMAGQDLAKVVSCTTPYEWTAGAWALGAGFRSPGAPRFHVVAYDFGIKHNILRLLAERGCRLTVVPAETPAEAVLALSPDGVFLSNGPGDPEPCAYAIRAIATIVDAGVPTFGICLGHQLLASRVRRADGEDEIRPSRRESPGAGPRYGRGADHEPEPRLRRRRRDAPPAHAHHARVAVRRQPAGHRAHRSPGVRIPGAPGSEPRPARPRVSLRPLREDDGTRRPTPNA